MTGLRKRGGRLGDKFGHSPTSHGELSLGICPGNAGRRLSVTVAVMQIRVVVMPMPQRLVMVDM